MLYVVSNRYPDFNPLPHRQILGSSNSAANTNMMSKYEQIGYECLIE